MPAFARQQQPRRGDHEQAMNEEQRSPGRRAKHGGGAQCGKRQAKEHEPLQQRI
jgi:hypothetical protein